MSRITGKSTRSIRRRTTAVPSQLPSLGDSPVDGLRPHGERAAPIKRRRGRIALVVTAALAIFALGGTAAYAAGFSDVPAGHPFKADIDWLAGNGITSGFPDGTYRPTQPVTRQSAAAFLHRYNNTFEMVSAESSFTVTNMHYAAATCPSGKRALGGGGSTSNSDLFMTDSYRSSTTSWAVRWESDNNVNASGTSRTWVLCGPV